MPVQANYFDRGVPMLWATTSKELDTTAALQRFLAAPINAFRKSQ